jgi:cellulose synthase/poly-beta-1,6-N-acetylglucosamine synthase-like glycosyltransferase
LIIGLNALVTAVYVVAFFYGLDLIRRSLHQPHLLTVSDEEARAIPSGELPIYTVLIPAYKEAEVIAQTIAAIDALEYPRDRLDIKLLLEEGDVVTRRAALAAGLPSHMEIVRVPYAVPQTKPKACNYGLAQARGDLVTIFDAEDRPEPLQLRRAIVAFSRCDPSVACLQAKLSYHNTTQNLITAWFTIEYATWFSLLLPALADKGGPVPLGGTSMHLKRSVLNEVGGWDPYNVTEDADLGVRLHRLGYRTRILESTTEEEANSDFVNWVKQRSHWHKGYMQTWLVHARHPVLLVRQIGLGGFLGFNLVVGATPFVALISPIFWLLTLVWFMGRPGFIEQLFPAWIYFPALFCLISGNFMVLYTILLAIRLTGHTKLLGATLLWPAYWLMMSIAAVRALLQLPVAPWFWERTVHGLAPSRMEEGRVASQ